MATAPQPFKADVLNSWKEIASYLGRGVRTVQRYERDLKLPVRRPRGKSRSAVIALTSELDDWLRKTPRSALNSACARPALPPPVTTVPASLRQNEDLPLRCNELRNAHLDAMRTLLEEIHRTQELLRHSLQLREELASIVTRGAVSAPAAPQKVELTAAARNSDRC